MMVFGVEIRLWLSQTFFAGPVVDRTVRVEAVVGLANRSL